MHIQLRFFASLREAFGISSESLVLPDGTGTVHDVLAILRRRGGVWAEALADAGHVKVAVDQCLGTLASPVHDGAEVAFFPPVTGG